jgi:hypothetical protein
LAREVVVAVGAANATLGERRCAPISRALIEKAAPNIGALKPKRLFIKRTSRIETRRTHEAHDRSNGPYESTRSRKYEYEITKYEMDGRPPDR